MVVTAVPRERVRPGVEHAAQRAHQGSAQVVDPHLDRAPARQRQRERGDAARGVRGSSSAITATQLRPNHFFQRPDATHLEVDTLATSLTGYSVNLQMRKQAGTHWRGGLGTALTSPRYEVNDLGFSYRTDRRDFQSNLTYLENRLGKSWRSWNTTATGRLERNYDWQPILSFTTLEASGLTLG